MRTKNLIFGGHLLAWAGTMISGCALGVGSVAAPIMTVAEQEAEILKVVPKGTPRGQAVEKLERAGVEGQFGISDSIYYCDVWHRRGGNVTHLDIALLFDEEGNFYAMRPADAAVHVEEQPRDRRYVSASANEPSVAAGDRNEEAGEFAAPADRRAADNPFEGL